MHDSKAVRSNAEVLMTAHHARDTQLAAAGATRRIRASGTDYRVDFALRDALPPSGARERPELAAIREIDDLVARANSVRGIFDDVVAVVRRVLPLRAFVIVPRDERSRPFSWSASRSERSLAEAAAIAALEHLRGSASLEEFDPRVYAARSRIRWISAPIVDDAGIAYGLVAVATSGGTVDQRGVAFVSCVARKLACLLGRGPIRGDVSALAIARAERARAQTAQASRMNLLVGEATALLFDSLDYRTTLRQTTRLLCAQAAAGCAVDLGTERFVHAPTFAERHLDRVLRDVARAVVAAGRPLASEARDAAARRAAYDLGVDWLVSVPLRSRRSILGALTIFGHTDRHAPFDLRAAAELARRVASAIENGRMYESAIETARVREHVLSTVSHDLKNPLGVILMSSARMLQEIDRRDGRKHVETIQRCAQRMRRLVADILDVAAIDGGALKMRPRRCDVRSLVDEALDAVTPMAEAAGISLENAVDQDLPPVWADPDRVLQVLSNLLGNALRFTPRGGAIRARARIEEQAVAIAVEDTGCGIAKEELALVFDRFWQSPSSTTLGTGLGLAICKSIVELSGGRIWAESELGVGTTMTFTLPLRPPRPSLVPRSPKGT